MKADPAPQAESRGARIATLIRQSVTETPAEGLRQVPLREMRETVEALLAQEQTTPSYEHRDRALMALQALRQPEATVQSALAAYTGGLPTQETGTGTADAIRPTDVLENLDPAYRFTWAQLVARLLANGADDQTLVSDIVEFEETLREFNNSTLGYSRLSPTANAIRDYAANLSLQNEDLKAVHDVQELLEQFMLRPVTLSQRVHRDNVQMAVRHLLSENGTVESTLERFVDASLSGNATSTTERFSTGETTEQALEAGRFSNDYETSLRQQTSEPGTPLLRVQPDLRLPFTTNNERPVIVITDPHGIFDTTWRVLERALQLTGFEADIDFNGDYIDKGTQTKALIDHMLGLRATYTGGNVVFGVGTHEDTIRNALADLTNVDDLRQIFAVQSIDRITDPSRIIRAGEQGHDPRDVMARAVGWMKVAAMGPATLSAYGVDPRPFTEALPTLSQKDANGREVWNEVALAEWHRNLRDTLLSAMPASHVAFLKSNLPLSRRHGDVNIVHAGMDLTLPADEQDPISQVWVRGKYHRYQGAVHPSHARFHITGHTSFAKPDIKLWVPEGGGQIYGRMVLDVNTARPNWDGQVAAAILNKDGSLRFVMKPKGKRIWSNSISRRASMKAGSSTAKSGMWRASGNATRAANASAQPKVPVKQPKRAAEAIFLRQKIRIALSREQYLRELAPTRNAAWKPMAPP